MLDLAHQTPPTSSGVFPGPWPVALETVGDGAARCMASNGHGAVLAVFQRCLYVRISDGGIFCIGLSSLGEGPLNVLCGSDSGFDECLSTFVPGTPVRISNNRLWIEDIEFDASNASPWKPARSLVAPSRSTVQQAFNLLAPVFAEERHQDGFNPLLARILSNGRRPVLLKNADSLLSLAIPGVAALGHWLTAKKLDLALPDEVQRLVGLGPGLTPSGDDFLGGALIALRHLNRQAQADALWAAIEQKVRRDTNMISAAHLAAAGSGQGHRRVHDFLGALSAPGNPGLSGYCRRLGQMGHSSGWDTMAGILLAATSWHAGVDP